MLVVISNPDVIHAEAAQINSLFKAGLEFFHLRKPRVTEVEIAALLQQIDKRYYPKVALHQHHQLAEKFGIKRLHFTEQKRLQTEDKSLELLYNDGYVLSTSIHQLNDYNILNNRFKYCFYGPVFDSISKPGYGPVIVGRYDEVILKSDIDKEIVSVLEITKNTTKLIAIGGIKSENIQTLKAMGFKGAAVLGSIWQEPDKAVSQFKNLAQLWN